jgi:polyisoprenoid-binding protein YceI
MSTTLEKTPTLPAGTWTVDPVHSQIGFAVGYHVGTFRGSVSPVDARLVVDKDGQANLTGSAAVSDVKVQDENLAAHLQAPDFFDAERTPEVSFASRTIGISGHAIEVAGELTIKDRTVPITAKGRLGEQKTYMERAYFGLELEAKVDRTRFGLDWNNPLPNGEPALANEVTITAELYLTQT